MDVKKELRVCGRLYMLARKGFENVSVSCEKLEHGGLWCEITNDYCELHLCPLANRGGTIDKSDDSDNEGDRAGDSVPGISGDGKVDE